jgi:serine/threonine protein kinase
MTRPPKDDPVSSASTPSGSSAGGEPAGSSDLSDTPTAALTPDDIARARAALEGRDRTDDGPPSFASGQTVAGRYRVFRFIARSAMGEVYEVEDTVLQGHVALKTIRTEIAREKNATERFRREIALSRRITHPNVCRIYDIGIHEGGVAAPDPCSS